ncbi:MAG: hypothetical protein EZS28_010815 [Streblomastix strix]|uniref:Uncharacterized protein n=1 Tax=Streblomastix strix TaxID=222440 RepID=A0A5J4WFJ8_9EUKA|nr:MAG: hypothetical protein EZS28_010815 [Streblomastix strix]
MGVQSGPVSKLHPGIGEVMGTVGNIAGKVDSYLNKRYGLITKETQYVIGYLHYIDTLSYVNQQYPQNS